MKRSFYLSALLSLIAVSLSLAQSKPGEISADDLTAVKAAEAARIAVISKVYGSVVAIYGNDRKGGGSGVLYDPAGYALTNHHVVAAAGDEGWAGLADGKLYRWKLLGTDPGGDVAIIRLQGRADFPISPLGDSETVKVGDWSMAMGNPFVLAEDQRPTVTLGIVSGVHRFQPGDGLNTLVYGNCIQVDSSINPGNSGGPLFNLRGEVIGINGRGSFEERGRVNVGLGYAISSNQIKNFIPDLLATKVAQHGTLDAQFGNRLGGVICQTINLNAPAARAGLELGDRLVAFEGVEITNANQFTNIISTYPADWPCEVTFEHPPGGARKTIHVRLTALPYDLSQPMPPMPMPAPDGEEKKSEGEEKKSEGDNKKSEEKQPEAEEQPKPADRGQVDEEKKPDDKSADEKPAEEKPGEEKKPDSERRPQPMPIRIGPQRAPLEPGKVRFPELMRESVTLLLKKWQAGAQAPEALEATEEIVRDNEVIGTATIVLAADGRFRVSIERKDERGAVGFDGKSFWRQDGQEKAEEVPFKKAVREPLAAHAVAMTLMLRGESHESFGMLALDGGDKAQRQVAYRLSTTPAEQDPLYVWLSVFGSEGRLGLQLLKTGVGLYDDEPVPALACYDWKSRVGINWPHRKVYVKGFAETAGEELHTKSVEPMSVSDELFRMP
jgi:S1-C subfamily serine protease